MEFLRSKGIDIVTLVLIIAFCYPILVGMLFKLKSRSMMETIKSLLSSVAVLISIILTVIVVRDVVIQDKYNVIKYIHDNISLSFTYLITKNKIFIGVVYLLVFLIINGILKAFIELINSTILKPISHGLDRRIHECGGTTRALLGGLFQIPKAIGYVLILSALLAYAGIFLSNGSLNKALSESKLYNYIDGTVIHPIIDSNVAKALPNILEDSFKVEENGSTDIETEDGYIRGVVFYNGITLNEGVESNENIDAAAKDITAGMGSTYEKGKAIYNWVGNNIKYDDNKAVEVMNNSNTSGILSGAINTFNTRRGVCFDYACLYVAMCRANNIGVRLVIGEGYNGMSWVSHSWNEIYIPEENRWVNVDCTFYDAGNYYDNSSFNSEHRNRKIAGEWY